MASTSQTSTHQLLLLAGAVARGGAGGILPKLSLAFLGLHDALGQRVQPAPYTHLTLPTKKQVRIGLGSGSLPKSS